MVTWWQPCKHKRRRGVEDRKQGQYLIWNYFGKNKKKEIIRDSEEDFGEGTESEYSGEHYRWHIETCNQT